MKTIKNKNKYTVSIRKQLSRFVVVLVVFSMFSNVLNINSTYAYFSDEATISGNTFTAGILDLSTDKTDLGTTQLGVLNNLTVTNSGSLPFKYGIKAEFSNTSDIAFCNQLNATVSDGTNTYTNNLLDFNFSQIIEKGGHDDLVINITDPSDSVVGRTCDFNFALKAWQEELDYTQGFTDIVYVSTIVNSEKEGILTDGDVVLNEFLANPNGTQYGFNFGNDSSLMPQGEWVELYNNGDKEVDLNGWYIVNKNWTIDINKSTVDVNSITNKIIIDSSHTVDGYTIIPAHGWLVVYMNKEVLDNGLDYIRLFNSKNIQKDSIAYGAIIDHCYLKPTPDSENNSNPSSSLCLLGVPGNKSYARIPDGIGAWVDPIPTPGEPNELAEEIIPEAEEQVLELPVEKVAEIITDEKKEVITLEKAETEIPVEETKEEVIEKETGEEVKTIVEDIQQEEIKEEASKEETKVDGPVEEETEKIPAIEIAAE